MITIKDNLLTFNKLTDEGIINCFTLKPYDFKDFANNPNRDSQLEKIYNDLNVKIKLTKKPNQTHTNNVKVLDESNKNDQFDDVDGLVTNLKDVALVTSLADCQGILLYDKNKKAIANIHSGWKGTLNKIVVNAINLMIDTYNSNPNDIEAYLTPSIMKCCFEVDKDVVDMFKDNFDDIVDLISLGDIKEGKQKYYIDLLTLNKRTLLNLGIKEENIISSNICSKCNDNIQSYRRDKSESGRNIAIICMQSEIS